MKQTVTVIRISCMSLLLAFASSIVMAQDGAQGDTSASPLPDQPSESRNVAEEVLVTGSYIKGLTQENLASPLQSIDYNDIGDLGAIRMEDVINNLTINTGSENNPDAFTQNFTTGTSNINLRGLGVASTLVLLNGRRQTYSAFTTDKGENFVDTSGLVPLIAVDRVEILKDGAASLYGSDAVAGVVNFITRNDFEGFELQLEALTGDSQGDTSISGIYGKDFGKAHLIAAFSHLDRDGLGTDERRLSRIEDDTSRAGFPGTFIAPFSPTSPIPAGAWQQYFNSQSTFTHPFIGNRQIADFFEPLLAVFGGQPVPGASQPAFADPDCQTIAATDDTTLPPDTFPLGACQYDFGESFTLVPDEERLQLYSHLDIAFTESLNFFLELALADNTAERRNSPSFPITTTPIVCGDGSLDSILGSSCAALGPHPDNPFGVDVLFVGRIRGSGSEPLISHHDSKTSRVAAGLSGNFNGRWDWSVDLTGSGNEFELSAEDTLANEFQRALLGLGGEDCVGTVGVDIAPGMGPCSYFNPFGSSLTGTGTPNTEAIFDYITGDLTIDAEAELTTLSGLITGDLFEMAGGNTGLAVGVQLRKESLDYDYDENANNNNFIFFRGNPDFSGNRDIKSLFSELAMPILDNLDIQLSVRYEDYEDSGSSTDPKVGVLYHPTENLGLRASLGTSFRAPSLFQQNGIQTTLVEIKTPTLGKQFLPVRAQPNLNDPLKPEEADVMNIGTSWTNESQAFEVNLDYWAYDYENVIIQQNPQAILNASATDPQADSQVEKSPTGISLINVYYDNASSLETDGIDLGASYTWADTSTGLYLLGLDLTKVMSYDLVDPQAGPIDGLGKRNFENFASSVPELRANLHFLWSHRGHAVNVFVRYIDSYVNDQLDLLDQPKNQLIDSHTTVDLQYSYQFESFGSADEGMTLSIGGINVTDEDPPYVSTNGGYDSKVHDPRGALYYLRATIPF